MARRRTASCETQLQVPEPEDAERACSVLTPHWLTRPAREPGPG